VTYVLALIAGGLALLYVGLLALLWRFQEQIVFQPPRGIAFADVAARQVHYRAEDGTELFAFVVGECGPPGPVVLAFHGNADLSRWFVPWAAELARTANVCVIVPEYRGYDGLAGIPTYTASAYDARAALAFARDSLDIALDRLVYYGHSLGSAIATELATSNPPRSLVLQSPFTSAREMSRRLFVPGVRAFWSIISRVHFDTKARVRSLTMPVSVAHGDKDLIIPVEMGREVFGAAQRPGELLIVPGAGHNDVAELGGRTYWSWLAHAVHAGDSAASSLDPRIERRSAL
jgi:pimeloyl-ACP methyl ester carboxylesterase